MEIKAHLGTHEVVAYQVADTESLQFVFTWHEPVVVHNWTLAKIKEAEEYADYDSHYAIAENRFIRKLVGAHEIVARRA